MQVVRSKAVFEQSDIKQILQNAIVGVTIGNFDCLHLGHQKLFQVLTEDLNKIDSPLKKIKVLISFYPHPKRVFFKIKRDTLAERQDVHSFLSFQQRYQILKKAGFDYYFLIRFTKEFATLEPEVFLQSYLLNPLNPKLIVVGDDWCFGKERSGTPEKLCEFATKYKFQSKIVPGQMLEGKRISTTLIKELLSKDELSQVKNYLGRDFSLSAKVINGEKRGRKLGFPTANLNVNFQILPTNGVYACRVAVGSEVRDAIVNIGVRPTFDSKGKRIVEVHILDHNNYNLYDSKIEVMFVKKIRDEMKFPALEELRAQITKDIEIAKAILHDPKNI
ncbi:MAG: bifunctional riboflavin kinase/FAD synthetase [Proteobacteria bacterium]|nr:bifunctional riboflavin kinase/FAD synthetase [Pseudomonadota bacterium]